MPAFNYVAIDTVIFDLDGTLIDSEPDLRIALNQLLTLLGRRPVTRDEVVMMVGDGVLKLVERALRVVDAENDVNLDTAVAKFLKFYEALTFNYLVTHMEDSFGPLYMQLEWQTLIQQAYMIMMVLGSM